MPPPVLDAQGSCYKQSMLRILEFVGLEHYGTPEACMPRKTAEEHRLISAHLEAVTASESVRQRRLREAGIRPKHTPQSVYHTAMLAAANDWTIFLSFEESNEWKAFLQGVPKTERNAATVRRRLSLALWQASSSRACLWCWLPAELCVCEQLEAYRAQMPASDLAQVPVTMLLHPEELMRSTNTGHVAAFLLDAPIRVWGVAADDAYFDGIAQEVGTGTLHLSLYPEKNAPTLGAVIEEEGIRAPDSAAEGAGGGATRVHLILSDSTWSQALSLNRHIPRGIRRVALTINEDYDALFSALRKRTRETGVSTLEATSMAVAECLAALGRPASGAAAADVLTQTMKRYVDLKCLAQYAPPCFDPAAPSVGEFLERRDASRRAEAEHRTETMDRQIAEERWARGLLLPPVLNYCYYCDRVLGWHRMPEHTLGKKHRYMVEHAASAMPSEKASQTVVPNFARPLRNRNTTHHESDPGTGSSGQPAQ